MTHFFFIFIRLFFITKKNSGCFAQFQGSSACLGHKTQTWTTWISKKSSTLRVHENIYNLADEKIYKVKDERGYIYIQTTTVSIRKSIYINT